MLEDALAHLAAGRPSVAAPIIEAHVERTKEDPYAWFILGACRHALKDLHGAAQALARSIELRSANAEAHVAYVAILRDAGNAELALASARRALALFPSEPRLHHAAALILEDLGQTEQAIAHYGCAIAASPHFADAHHNRGLLLARIGRLTQAESNYAAYIGADPRSARAHSGLADVQIALGKYEEALKSLDTLLGIAPEDGTALVRRGVALACLRRFSDSKAALAKAWSDQPQQTHKFVQRLYAGDDVGAVLSPQSIFLSRCYMALGQSEWSGWDDFVSEMRKVAGAPNLGLHPATTFMAQHLPLSGPERHGVARHIASRIEATVATLPPLTPRSRSRIRVGVLSPDYREHLNAYLLLPLFELVDRQRFEVYAYSLAADDGSAARCRVRAAAETFRDLHDLSDKDAALCIHNDDVDILVDAAGHTAGGRFAIVAQRPARIQVLYLGFSGSLASTRVDFAIVDHVVARQDAEWSEKLVYLPHTWFLYDFRMPFPKGAVSRRDYGLPDDAFVYCAFHRAEKIAPDVFDMWMRVIAQVPRSVLWLLDLPAVAKANLRARAGAHGVDPTRLVFAPFEPRYGDRYLPRQSLGDLMLDSIHHNAFTTACDALGAGLPVLTLPGGAIASRGGASLARAAGLPELVMPDTETFVRTAVAFAEDPSRLRSVKDKLGRNRHTAPLFDTHGRVRELQAAFEEMLTR